MRIVVTGASGFVGRHVVAVALASGHEVARLVRRPTARPPLPGRSDTEEPAITDIIGDVRHPDSWQGQLRPDDVVVHLAAAVGGDFHTQFSTTVLGTESLLRALTARGVRRLVHISTFSVYDYRALAVGAELTEASPIEARPLDRDDYAQTKLVQERLVREFASAGNAVTVVRPGAVYGPDNLWNAGLALGLPGGFGIGYAPRSRLKLTYVENCAEAIVLAASRDEAIGATVNVVDDDLPTQLEYARAMRRAGFAVPHEIPVPYVVAIGGASLLAAINRRFAAGRAKLPGVFVPAKLDAQFRPLRYPNAHAKAVLGWHPRYGLDDALARIRVAEQAS